MKKYLFILALCTILLVPLTAFSQFREATVGLKATPLFAIQAPQSTFYTDLISINPQLDVHVKFKKIMVVGLAVNFLRFKNESSYHTGQGNPNMKWIYEVDQNPYLEIPFFVKFHLNHGCSSENNWYLSTGVSLLIDLDDFDKKGSFPATINEALFGQNTILLPHLIGVSYERKISESLYLNVDARLVFLTCGVSYKFASSKKNAD